MSSLEDSIIEDEIVNMWLGQGKTVMKEMKEDRMNLIALLISIGVVVAACVLYWWLERTFDITLEDIAGVFIGVICFAAAAGMIYIFICPVEDLEHTREFVYEITSDNQDENQSECSLLGDSCIVEEWSPICLIQNCVIDTRK